MVFVLSESFLALWAASLERTISVMAVVYTCCDSQFPKALTGCRLKQRRGSNKKTLTLGMEALKQALFCRPLGLQYTETKTCTFPAVINHSTYSSVLFFFKITPQLYLMSRIFTPAHPSVPLSASSHLLMPHCPLVVHGVTSAAPLLLIPISTCGVIETWVSSCQGLGHHVIEFCLVSQSAAKHGPG